MNPTGYLLPAYYREFLHVIDACEREVELVTPDGCHLHLKSKLAQYVAFLRVFQNRKIVECELITHSREDTFQILSYFLENRSCFDNQSMLQ